MLNTGNGGVDGCGTVTGGISGRVDVSHDWVKLSGKTVKMEDGADVFSPTRRSRIEGVSSFR